MAQKKVIEIDKTMAEHNQINPSEVIEQCLVRSFGLDKYQAIQSDLQKLIYFWMRASKKNITLFTKFGEILNGEIFIMNCLRS